MESQNISVLACRVSTNWGQNLVKTSPYPISTSIQPFPKLSAPNLPSLSQPMITGDTPTPQTNNSVATKPETPPLPSNLRGLDDLINHTDTMPGSSASLAPLGMTIQATADKSIWNKGNTNETNVPQSNQLQMSVAYVNHANKESDMSKKRK